MALQRNGVPADNKTVMLLMIPEVLHSSPA